MSLLFVRSITLLHEAKDLLLFLYNHLIQGGICSYFCIMSILTNENDKTVANSGGMIALILALKQQPKKNK